MKWRESARSLPKMWPHPTSSVHIYVHWTAYGVLAQRCRCEKERRIWVTSALSLSRCCHKVLYCSAEPISPCLAFPAGETCHSVVLCSVCHWSCVGGSALTLNILLTQTVFYLVLASLVCYKAFSKARQKQSISFFWRLTRIFICIF